jgi:hypothetical protein
MKQGIALLLLTTFFAIMLNQNLPFQLLFVIFVVSLPVSAWFGWLSHGAVKINLNNELISYLHNGNSITAKFKEQKVCHFCGAESSEIFYTNQHGIIRPFCSKCVTAIIDGLNIVEYDQNQKRIG